MAKEVLSIINTKPTTLDFELVLDGIEPSKMDVCLCIKTKEYYLKFPCKKSKGNWECKIPPLDHLEKGAYPFVIEVVADGYHFEAMSGTANVVGSFDIYGKKAEKLSPGTVDKKEESKPESKKEPKKEVKEETLPTKKVAEKKMDFGDKKFTDIVSSIFNKKDPTEQKKKDETLIEDKKLGLQATST